MWQSFSTRSNIQEIMDRPETSLNEIRSTLKDQAWINEKLGSGNATWVHAIPIMAKCDSDPVRILELACGGADISRHLVNKARELSKKVEVTCLDINEKALIVANRLSRDYPEISFVLSDVLGSPFRESEFDLVMMPMFLHHLTNDDVVEVLRTAGKISRGWVIVADLIRSPLAWTIIKGIAEIKEFHPVTKHDSALSVQRAFSYKELADIALKAEIKQWQIFRHGPFRMTLVYKS
jgi:ubiquinone/menaquinone biosynthesis C-methylase UbiE